MDPAISTPQIPHDLIREILEHLEDDKSTLCAVSLLSNILRQEAQIILYRNVTNLFRESLHLAFLRTVAASPHRLGLLVRTYMVSTPNMSRDLSAGIHNGLLVMCNLKRLDVYFLGEMEEKSPGAAVSVLRGCTFKLERFRWLSHPSEAREVIETFLRTQDMLRHIRMQFSPSRSQEHIQSVNSNISICPQLVSLVGTWQVIGALLPGNKIAALTVLNAFNSPPQIIDISSLASALEHIKALSHPFYPSRSEELNLYRVLPHCTSLTVMELENFDKEKVFAILPKLPALHTLILSRDVFSGAPVWQGEPPCSSGAYLTTLP